MNPSRSDLNRAAEDLRVIRSVLDQTATSFRALAPAFGRMGVVWLVCGLVWPPPGWTCWPTTSPKPCPGGAPRLGWGRSSTPSPPG